MVCAKNAPSALSGRAIISQAFQLVIAPGFAEAGARWSLLGAELDQRAERLLLQRGIGRVTYQAMICHTVPGQDGV
ncbi:hypothetical protein LNQ03_32405 [Klebsiella pneumoniae subsp. pneumoniae]|nr:hypothetical protein [Klebsiella pneumoniae subsp. pneumoniae]